MHLGNSTVSQIRTGNPDEGFQRLLLSISAATARGERGEALLRSICSASRECFQAAGAYIWRRDVPGDLLGVEADGCIAGHFPGQGPGQALGRDLQAAVAQIGRTQRLPIAVGNASNLLGQRLALALEWDEIALARLENPEGELIGTLVLTGCGPDWTPSDRQWFQTLAAHVSMALQNAQFFQRLEQANCHWEEMFDAISDFIVVHEESGNILRVNRSLAQFIGVQPDQLIAICCRLPPMYIPLGARSVGRVAM